MEVAEQVELKLAGGEAWSGTLPGHAGDPLALSHKVPTRTSLMERICL